MPSLTRTSLLSSLRDVFPFQGNWKRRENEKKSQGLTTQQKGKVLEKIKKTQYVRIRQDIARWRNALTAAENPENPNRTLLYQLYEDLLMDSHLSAVLSTRKQNILSEDFALFTDKTEDEEKTALLQEPWFLDFLHYSLDSLFFGHSLMELSWDGEGKIAGVELVPRANVLPELGEIKLNFQDRSGDFSYRQPAFASTLIEVGKPSDLGLLAKAAPNVLWKKTAQSSWSEYTELFGMPLRIGKTNTGDPERLDQLEQMLKQMGSASYGVFDHAEEIELVQVSRQDAWQVFDKLIERCNSEISKLILGQTMSTDSGSSLSQALVHKGVMDNYTWSDERMMEYVINKKLLPLLVEKGYPLEGAVFKWKYDKEQEE